MLIHIGHHWCSPKIKATKQILQCIFINELNMFVKSRLFWKINEECGTTQLSIKVSVTLQR